MFEQWRTGFKRVIAPVARGLVAVGVSANAVTVIGAVATTVFALATGVTGWLFPGAVVLTLAVIFDALDGSVAALTTGGTPFGAFLDSTLDRIADWAVLVGVILYFALHTDWQHAQASAFTWWTAVVGLAAALCAIMTAFVTSYARARAEAVGFHASNGIATRSDRLVIALVSMAVSGLTGADVWLAIGMVLLAVLGVITVIQRIHTVYRQMHAPGEEPDPAAVEPTGEAGDNVAKAL